MVCEKVFTLVNKILCCTQKDEIAEDAVDIKIENIQRTEANSESLKRNSQNIVPTSNSKILGNYYIRFAKCKCEQLEQQNSSEDEIKLQVIIVTDEHCCGNLPEVDEPHRQNVPEIDIQNPKVTAEVLQSRRLPQLLVTTNSQCNYRAGNSTTSTSYLSYNKEQEPYKKKQDKINSFPLTSTKIDRTKKSKRSFTRLFAAIFRHSVSKISQK